ncbi:MULTISPECIES: SHOCT domain-containing protein [unclassified Streptomyces]|uniref:SHOCT domain-containing protein n=1 Tax=unclassified Streptomyces TaxID=2593676 RepID=UPI000939D542|nr:SHOCT domain-containing protein [Streptomyces sp. CB02009]OKJ49555.1 hypothetical protein AMK27_36535 [Streptomyces sp. CB02009]
MYLAYDFPLLSAFWSIFWIFLWILWFMLLFRVILDIFRDDELSGWAKFGWLLFTVVLPFVGVFVYVIARGKGMGNRERKHVQAQQREMDTYIRNAAGNGGRSQADELTKLSDLRARGDLTEEEFLHAKAQVMAGDGRVATRR